MRFYICRVKAYQSGWTIEAFPCSSGGWWFDVYDAYSGFKIDLGKNPLRGATFKKALAMGAKVAKKTRLPQQTIDFHSEQM